jgi:predicted  nucleic acid-binding Zn ribbon protein
LAAIRQAQAEEGQAMHNAAREAAKAEKVKLNRLTCRTDAPAWYATQVGRTVELRVAEADACPKCRERNVDNLVWDDGKVKCTTCGKQYTPPSK